jgi:hypothetical protein
LSLSHVRHPVVVNIILKFASVGTNSEAFPYPLPFPGRTVVGGGSAARLFLDTREKSSGSGARYKGKSLICYLKCL